MVSGYLGIKVAPSGSRITIMANSNLTSAKKAKNDEFYTQYHDIEKEVGAYVEFNPNVFRNKTVFLPCDDPEWSNFTKFFAQNFQVLGLKKLVSTSYAAESKKLGAYQPSLFEMESAKYDKAKTAQAGKIYTLTCDKTGDGKIDVNDLDWEYMTGDGDFRSAEVRALRDGADIIITNPPFSLFREFLAWVVEADKQFLLIGSMNAITYKEVFPLIKTNKMWLGPSISSGDREFRVPNDYPIEAAGWRIDENGAIYLRIKGVRWFTNIDHGRRHQPLQLMSMADNLRFNKKLKGKEKYDCYDNYDAIEVPFTDAIPGDYEGVMGVPISFLDKYSPEQFDILGITDRDNNSGMKTKEYTEEDAPNPGDLNRRGVIKTGDEYQSTYARLIIKHKA
jgi:hypothetical protein